MDASATELNSTRGTLRPKFIYCCNNYSNLLYRMNLLTRERHGHRLPHFRFKGSCRWSELPGGSLLITGGYMGVREVERIDTLREFAVSSVPPMHTARYNHAALHHSQYLYVLGGYSNRRLSECERYVCTESRWEVLPALPVACDAMSAVVLGDSLYALGGRADAGDLDTVQQLSFDSLTWELMELKLPQAACYFPCFKTDSQVYLMIKRMVYSFTPLQVKPIKSVPENIVCETSYYSRGSLLISYMLGEGIGTVEELTSL
jgi:hypothetical protein